MPKPTQPRVSGTDAPDRESGLLSRRDFLIGAGAAGLVLAFAPAGRSVASAADAVAEAAYAPSIWCEIDTAGRVTVNVTRAEMGQHVGTAVARMLADELEADWSLVRVNAVDSDPKWGTMVTGGSWSVWQEYRPMSQAGAAGRMALVDAGAKLLGVSASRCRARNGRVEVGSRSISYGDIVRRGSLSKHYTADELAKLPLKKPSERRLIGRPTDALDIPSKVDGSGLYGIDAKVDGMVYARPLIPPTRNGAKLDSVDDSAAKDVKGYLQTLILDDPSGNVPGWGLVIADSYHAANRAHARIKASWTPGKTKDVTEQDILDHARELIDDPATGALVLDDDGVDAAFAAADRVLEHEYVTHSVLHAQLEPCNALAFQKDGIWEIHTGNQWQTLILPQLATALGVSEDKVVMRTYLLGGGFGRRLNGDYAIPAALGAKALGRPVKVVLTREDDMRFDSLRSASVQKMRMAFDRYGKVTSMEQHAAAGWPTQVMVPSFMPEGTNGVKYDLFAIQGADHWYSVGPHRLRAVSNDLANDTFRPGWLRSVGSGWVNWALESFMDEAALEVGRDPFDFRIDLLKAEGRNAGSAPSAVGGASRQANVLRRLRELSDWDAKLPEHTGVGLATSYGQERDMPTWVACVARVRVNPELGRVVVEKLTLVADAGTIVHPDGALAQMEGAALWGLSMALHEGTVIEAGEVRDRNFDTYTPLRMRDVPELHIEFIDSTENPVGLGEPATTVVAPAIANAIFAASGVRIRELPIRTAAISEGLGAKA
jgi:CO/xanthine dehydrogenase Mo-binding subunit